MMEGKYVTELDGIGMQRAAEEKIEKRFGLSSGFLREQKLFGTTSALGSMEDLVKRDKERQQDGFPRRIRWRRVLIAPGKVLTIPYVVEEKLVHAGFEPKNLVNLQLPVAQYPAQNQPDIGESPGHGDGEVGDVIGEIPIRDIGDGDEDGDGDGDEPGTDAGDEDAEHFEEEAYDTGKRLTEQLKLPNLKEKVKKVPTDEYTYDLTDRHDGSGQVLDEEETLSRILETNIILGRITKDNIDATKIIVDPDDEVYRVLSKERVWKAQAVVFFVRDCSGSMWGEPTRALVSQHLLIYAWLLYQYEKRVIPRFIVHDHAAQEVTARQYFYYNSWGGTYLPSAYKKVNEIVEGEALESQYNIYLFQGTDGDDGGDGTEAIPQIKKILAYTNRMGVTLFKHRYYAEQGIKTIFEEYVERGEILPRRDVFRMHIMSRDFWTRITDEMNIEAIKALIAQD
jgi:hypothetical protein